MRLWTVLALAVLLSWAALGRADWVDDTGQTLTQLGSKAQVRHNFTDGTSSPLLRTLTKTTWNFSPQAGVAGTGNATGYLRCCNSFTAATAQCGKILVDVDGDGVKDDLPLNGDDGTGGQQRKFIFEVPPGFCYFEVVTSAAGQSARILVTGE